MSSPGIEKILRKDKHLKSNLGKEVSISLFKSIDNVKQLEGSLNKFDSDNIYIEKNNEIISLDRKNIALIKIKFEW